MFYKLVDTVCMYRPETSSGQDIRSGNDLRHGQIDVLSYEEGRTEDGRLQRRNVVTMKLFEVELLHHSGCTQK